MAAQFGSETYEIEKCCMLAGYESGITGEQTHTALVLIVRGVTSGLKVVVMLSSRNQLDKLIQQFGNVLPAETRERAYAKMQQMRGFPTTRNGDTQITMLSHEPAVFLGSLIELLQTKHEKKSFVIPGDDVN